MAVFTIASGSLIGCGPADESMPMGGTGSGGGTASEDGNSDTESSASPGCPELVYYGSLSFTTLAETEGVPLYTDVTGRVGIGVEDLRDLGFLRCLAVVGSDPSNVGGLSIGLSAHIESLAGLERLQRVDSLWIGQNEELRSLQGLENLRVVAASEEHTSYDDGVIRIQANPTLERIDLPALEEARLIEIGEQALGEQISEEPIELLGTWECLPDGNPALTEIRFDALQHLQALWIFGNQALESVDSLSTLAGITSAPFTTDEPMRPPLVRLYSNPSLPKSNIEAVWSSMGATAPALQTCGNQGEDEQCECFVGFE